MSLLQSVLLLAFVAACQSVLISWEESVEGKVDYRFFYFNVPADLTTKPYFSLVNGLEEYNYGTLGALSCPSGVSGVAIYEDLDNDGKKEWSCQSINELPFASTPTDEVINPPICGGTLSGIPALYNFTSDLWFCGETNQILTSANRITDEPCATGDFLTYDGELEAIRCIDPTSISEEDTLQARSDEELGLEIETRVDVDDDAKWHNFATSIDVTNGADASWHMFKWTPDIQYDLTVLFSNRPSPPVPLPFESELLAVTFASFTINGYNFRIDAPTSEDSFIGAVYKLAPNLGISIISEELTFTSTTATSGQVTFPTPNTVATVAAPGETFVAAINDIDWAPLDSGDDRLVVMVTLWIETKQSFTDFFFVGK